MNNTVHRDKEFWETIAYPELKKLMGEKMAQIKEMESRREALFDQAKENPHIKRRKSFKEELKVMYIEEQLLIFKYLLLKRKQLPMLREQYVGYSQKDQEEHTRLNLGIVQVNEHCLRIVMRKITEEFDLQEKLQEILAMYNEKEASV
ncbi:hypothetical protein MO973_25305 [Paenibacillus sp. TRM 82003]|nr:hypothetical protein [Paenibacillus sp. TRM 82003]